MDFFQDFSAKIKEIYGRLEAGQKMVLGSLIVLTLAVFIWLITWTLKVDYSLLYGNLEAEQAGKIIEKLEELNIQYKYSDGGKTIMIPADKIYDTRIKLASEGIANKTGTGFEIFDKTNIGMTEFVQNVNFKRATEGELQRTVESINGVDEARIHLVFPEDKLFKEDQKDPSASVLLTLTRKLRPKQITGIANFIASAVEGLDSDKINIVDQDGNVLTEHYEDSSAGLSSYQMKLQAETENKLTRKTQSMLDNIVGRNNAVVRINAELNFENIETTRERYDPESKVVRSEEIETSSDENEADSTSVSTENIRTNYEINRTVEHITNQVGNIKRISVSVNVNHKLDISEKDGEIVKTYLPRTSEELQSIESLVKNAVGYDSERGDAVVVNSLRFDDSEEEYYREQEEAMLKRKQLFEMLEKGGVLAVLLILMFILANQFKKIFAKPDIPEPEEIVRPALAEGTVESEGFYHEGEEGMPMGEGKISYDFKPMEDIKIEQTEAQQLQEAVKKFCLDNPEVAVRLIKSWLLEK
ncbi:MAG: flagellar M-ring protein FliF [Candidatus Cloacimonadota bacterium]|nr:MAG: flagellar M-ring protein FliF [Candidatus Cloacimonadota bacterium]